MKFQVVLAVLVTVALLMTGWACNPAPSPSPTSAPKPSASPAPVASPTPAASPASSPKTETVDVWPKMINIGSKSAGSGTYVMAVAMFKVIEAATGHKATPLPMATSAAFAQALEDKKAEFSIAGSPNFRWALEGRTGSKIPLTSIRTIATGAPLHYILGVRPDSGITKLSDIKGKTIIGKQAGSDMVAAAWPCILAAAGLTEKDVTFLPFTATTEITDAINEKRAQGEIWWTNASTSYVQELTTSGDIKLIPLTDEEIAKAVAKEPAFVSTVLPAGTFKGQDKPIKTFGMLTDIATRATLADEVVYAVTAAIHDRFSDIISYSPDFKEYILPDSIDPVKVIVPTHNGAIKYFKERGFWKKAHDDRQAKILSELKLTK